MQERKNIITFQGDPLTLVGAEVKVNQRAPDFAVLSADLKKFTLKDFAGKIKIICTVPSLDTPVCDLEIKQFNNEAATLAKNVFVIFVSMDLPFAQGRFCQNFRINNVKTFSDHALASFGENYGVLIKELRLLVRAVFIIDSHDKVCYVEYVPEITNHPNYAGALKAVQGLF